jgi:hypothetical protein
MNNQDSISGREKYGEIYNKLMAKLPIIPVEKWRPSINPGRPKYSKEKKVPEKRKPTPSTLARPLISGARTAPAARDKASVAFDIKIGKKPIQPFTQESARDYPQSPLHIVTLADNKSEYPFEDQGFPILKPYSRASDCSGQSWRDAFHQILNWERKYDPQRVHKEYCLKNDEGAVSASSRSGKRDPGIVTPQYVYPKRFLPPENRELPSFKAEKATTDLDLLLNLAKLRQEEFENWSKLNTAIQAETETLERLKIRHARAFHREFGQLHSKIVCKNNKNL